MGCPRLKRNDDLGKVAGKNVDRMGKADDDDGNDNDDEIINTSMEIKIILSVIQHVLVTVRNVAVAVNSKEECDFLLTPPAMSNKWFCHKINMNTIALYLLFSFNSIPIHFHKL